jgi:hypothetical protein
METVEVVPLEPASADPEPVTTEQPLVEPGANVGVAKKRGRPPGSKNKTKIEVRDFEPPQKAVRMESPAPVQGVRESVAVPIPAPADEPTPHQVWQSAVQAFKTLADHERHARQSRYQNLVAGSFR